MYTCKFDICFLRKPTNQQTNKTDFCKYTTMLNANHLSAKFCGVETVQAVNFWRIFVELPYSHQRNPSFQAHFGLKVFYRRFNIGIKFQTA